MSIIKHVTLQKIVAHDFRYHPRILSYVVAPVSLYSKFIGGGRWEELCSNGGGLAFLVVVLGRKL